ncbi:uncharacterized protein LOC127005167 [Eriocheir sinensis]|uniref:uncharacterized protein LOC127005167 n=1 Tax=Eriocheir sinensis TaxID=95602 RepID=UPI0021C6D842|nr:uncharacterized protein LOC127005167 [Eriocheir sinensis]
MMTVTCTRLLLVALTLLAVFQAAASFMCYTKTMGEDDTSVTFCSSGTCYSVGGSVGESKDSKKGCAEESHEDGCISGGIPGIISGHTCYCSSPLCNSAYSPSIALPMLVLPALLQRLLS